MAKKGAVVVVLWWRGGRETPRTEPYRGPGGMAEVRTAGSRVHEHIGKIVVGAMASIA